MKKMRTFHFLYGKNEDISFFYPWKIEDISFSLRKKWGHFIFLSLKNEATSFSLWRPLHEKWGHFIFFMAATSWKNAATLSSLWRPLHAKMRPLHFPYGGHFMKKWGHFIFLMAATSCFFPLKFKNFLLHYQGHFIFFLKFKRNFYIYDNLLLFFFIFTSPAGPRPIRSL